MFYRMNFIYQVLIWSSMISLSRSNLDQISEDLAWWQKGMFYRLLPYTFQDSNNDGVGDQWIEVGAGPTGAQGTQGLQTVPGQRSPLRF